MYKTTIHILHSVKGLSLRTPAQKARQSAKEGKLLSLELQGEWRKASQVPLSLSNQNLLLAG